MAISGSGSASGGVIYHRSYATLRLPLVQLAWRAVTVVAALWAWFLTLPWLAIKYIAPANFQNALKETEDLFFQYATPIITFLQDTTYKTFDFADYLLDKALVSSKHIYNNYLKDVTSLSDYYLGLAESRTAILQDHGLNGIRLALSSGPSGAAAPLTKPPVKSL